MTPIDHIGALEREGLAAVAAAQTTAELAEVRLRYLSRAAELPQILRAIGASYREAG